MYELLLENALVTVCIVTSFRLPFTYICSQVVYQHEVKRVNTKLFFNLDIMELCIHTAKNTIPTKKEDRTGAGAARPFQVDIDSIDPCLHACFCKTPKAVTF